MPPALDQLGQFVPQRRCAVCGEPTAVLRVVLVGRRWVCRACLRDPQRVAATPGDGDQPGQLARQLHQVDLILRYGGMLLRGVVFLALALLASGSPLWRHVLTGALTADVATWAVAAAFDLRANRTALALQLAVYLTIGHFWLRLTGGTILPAALEDRAVVMLVFTGVFALKISFFSYHALMSGRD